MALTIYSYKRESFHKGFKLSIMFLCDESSDRKILKSIIENEFSSSCIDMSVDLPAFKNKTHLGVFTAEYEQGKNPSIICDCNEVSLKVNHK